METRSLGRSEPASVSAMVAELRTANRLLAVLATRGLEQRQAVLLLDAVGLQPRQIAEVLEITPNSARVALHRARKASRTRPNVDYPENRPTDGDE